MGSADDAVVEMPVTTSAPDVASVTFAGMLALIAAVIFAAVGWS